MATQTLVRPAPITAPRPRVTVRPAPGDGPAGPVGARDRVAPSMRVRGATVGYELEARTTTFRADGPVVVRRRVERVGSARPEGVRATGVRLTRRGRLALLLALTVLALVVGAVLQAGAPAEAAPDGSGAAVTRTVTVGPGQTLWEIARVVRPDADPRETVARIQELNGLTTATVWAGQPLIVPA